MIGPSQPHTQPAKGLGIDAIGQQYDVTRQSASVRAQIQDGQIGVHKTRLQYPALHNRSITQTHTERPILLDTDRRGGAAEAAQSVAAETKIQAACRDRKDQRSDRVRFAPKHGGHNHRMCQDKTCRQSSRPGQHHRNRRRETHSYNSARSFAIFRSLMNTRWTEFLATQIQRPATFATVSALYATLAQYGILRLCGAEAGTFLHAQFTCDVLALPPDRWTWGAYCSAKGRVLANFILWKDREDILVLLPQVLVEPLRKRLQMFVLRSKVSIQDDSSQSVILGLRPGDDPSVLGALGSDSSALPPALIRWGETSLLHLTGKRTFLIAPCERAQKHWQDLQDTTHPGRALDWDRTWITQGEPWIFPPTQDAFVPQMLNLERLGAVSFTKGCYPGQEIVARSQHLGQVKRRLYRFKVITTETVVPGTPLYAVDREDQSAGTVVNAVKTEVDTSEILAVVHTAAHSAELHWRDPKGPLLVPCPLPYEVPGTVND